MKARRRAVCRSSSTWLRQSDISTALAPAQSLIQPPHLTHPSTSGLTQRQGSADSSSSYSLATAQRKQCVARPHPRRGSSYTCRCVPVSVTPQEPRLKAVEQLVTEVRADQKTQVSAGRSPVLTLPAQAHRQTHARAHCAMN